MKIIVKLSNMGGELDRRDLDIGDEENTELISMEILGTIGAWCLAPGDTITIEEVER